MPVSKLGTEPLEKTYLFVAELDLTFPGVFLQSQQPLVANHQVVSAPDASNAP
jgi:hypothetical protein